MISIHQASLNAAAAYLQTKLTGVEVAARWPERDFPGKAVTIIAAGARRDYPLPPRVVSKTNVGANQTNAIWEIAECALPLQLDVWAVSHIDRDDIIARLDQHLRSGFGPIASITNKDPVANGFFVKIADGWEASDAHAKFSFSGPDYEDYPESVGRRQFRATYRGNAFMKLSVPAVSPRQKQIILTAYLDGVSPREETVIS